MDIRFLGHSAFELTDGETTILIDPFLTGNPKAAITAQKAQANVILITHGHSDHVGDAVSIAKRTGAPVVAIVELAAELEAEGVTVRNPNLGGTETFDWGWVKLFPAWHTSTSAKGTASTPAGLLIHFAGTTIYHTGDTCLFSDLALVGRRTPVDVALVCCGGHFTMDPTDAVEAVSLIEPQVVIPCHYNTFPAIEIDVEAFQSEVDSRTSARAVVLDPGESHTV